ncbi:hypothetical protein PFISCL1PPCAC_28670, partial [Pristionchus fissidentatus]
NAVHAVHTVVALIGTSENCILLFCMFKYTPPSFRVFGLLMKWSVLYISYGPCGLINSMMCYVSFTLTMTVDIMTIYITFESLVARLHIIKHGSISTLRTVVLLVTIATPAPLI